MFFILIPLFERLLWFIHLLLTLGQYKSATIATVPVSITNRSSTFCLSSFDPERTREEHNHTLPGISPGSYRVAMSHKQYTHTYTDIHTFSSTHAYRIAFKSISCPIVCGSSQLFVYNILQFGQLSSWCNVK